MAAVITDQAYDGPGYAVDLVKEGPGTLELARSNGFAGSVLIHDGVLAVSHPQGLGLLLRHQY